MLTTKEPGGSAGPKAGTSQAKLEPRILDTQDIPTAERFDFINSVYSPKGLCIGPRQLTPDPADVKFLFWDLGHVLVTRAFSAGHVGKTLYKRAEPCLSIRKYYKGRVQMWTEDTYLDNRTGDILVSVDSSKKAVFGTQDLNTLSIIVPLSLLTFDAQRFSTHRIFRAGTPENHLLSSLIDYWFRTVRRTPLDGAIELETKIIDSFNAILGVILEKGFDNPIEMNARAQAIRSYLDQQVTHGDLDIDDICRQFATSRATLYREFSDEGGLHRYFTRRKLQTAMLEIADSKSERGRINEISEKYGYRDQLEFSCAFNREFDMAPSDVLKLPDLALDKQTTAHPFLLQRQQFVAGATRSISDEDKLSFRGGVRSKQAKLEPRSLDTQDIPAAERFDFLNDVYDRKGLHIGPRRSADSPVDIRVLSWDLGQVLVTRAFSAGHVGKTLVNRKEPRLSIRKHYKGRVQMWIEDTFLQSSPGDVLVSIDSSKKAVFGAQGIDTLSILIPLGLLTFDTKQFSTHHVFRAGTPQNHLLSAVIDFWFRKIPSTPTVGVIELERIIANSINAIFGMELEQSIEDPIIMNARTCAIRSYLDQQLRHGEVDIDFICRQFAASRATIYREFSNEGGLRRYVSRRRLLTAMFEIADSKSERGRINEISEKYGYRDQFEFSRAFRREFDMAPSDVLRPPTGASLSNFGTPVPS